MGFRCAPGLGRELEDAPVLVVVCGDPRTQKSYPLVTQLLRGELVFDSSLASAFST